MIAVSGRDFAIASKHDSLDTWHARINAGKVGSATSLAAAIANAGGLPEGLTLPDAVDCVGYDPVPAAPATVPVAGSQWFALRAAGSATSCLDGTSFARVETASCTLVDGYPAAHQFWQLIPADTDDPSVVVIRPRHAPGTRLQVNPSNGEITLASADTASVAQRWRLQRAETGELLIVTAADGKALQVPAEPGNVVGVAPGAASEALIAEERYPLLFATGAIGTTLTIGAETPEAGLSVQFFNGESWAAMTDLLPMSRTQIRFASTSLNLVANNLRLVFPDDSVAYEFTVTWESLVATAREGFE